MDAGELNQRLDILDLTPMDAAHYAWRPRRRVWGKVTLTGKTCYFSKVGLGARAVEIVLRDQPLSLAQAIRWGDTHILIQEVLPPVDGYMTVQGAVADLGEWTRKGDQADDLHFPAAITEKYVRYAQEEPMASHTVTYVLVTPKVIRMAPSELVSNLDAVYVVTACHTIDPWKNEYEIVRREEP